MMTLFRAVAWDIDGTLIDSEPLHERGLVAASAALGVDISDLEPEAFRGVHAIDIWEALKPRFPAGSSFKTWIAAIESLLCRSCGGASTRIRARSRRCASLPSAELRKRACRIPGAPSSTPISRRWESAQIIAFSLSLDDVSSGKPDPEPYREAARRFALPVAEVVAVEDSGAGARSARAAGLHVVGYSPSGEPFVGVDRSIAKLMEVVALFDA